MPDSWDGRIQRAERLAGEFPASAPLLTFYAGVLGAQRDVDLRLRSMPRWQPTGSLEHDLPFLRPAIEGLVRATAALAPPALAGEAPALSGTDSTLDAALLGWWEDPSDRQFFAKAALQPYAEWLARIPLPPAGRHPAADGSRCPFCGGPPQLGVLRTNDEGDGGRRLLLCATCLTCWKTRRVWCPACGEEDDARLGYVQAAEFPHVRLDICETCGRYLKTIDLTRLGTAVPLVDDVASAPLDVWAQERGYARIELNLVGL